MTSFKTRIRRISRTCGPVILANDYPSCTKNLVEKTTCNIRKLSGYICGVKLNHHLLLPLGRSEIKKITKTAERYDLVTIADIKLNDIGNTNKVAIENLWDLGFDAVIVNPIMGPDGLGAVIRHAHRHQKGIITLCHMSAPEAAPAYDLDLGAGRGRLYELFLEWAIQEKADGIIAGATFPSVIQYCKTTAQGKLDIYSPGIGVQGGDPGIISAGTDYMIVGRTILNAKDPVAKAQSIQGLAFER